MLINEFLKKFSERKLKQFGVINTRRNLLNGQSVEPLIRLMKKNNVESLTGPNAWFIDINHNYYNPYSKEVRNGNLKTSDISRLGVVFDAQNNHLNPFYVGFRKRNIPEESVYMSESLENPSETDIHVESKEQELEGENQFEPTKQKSVKETQNESTSFDSEDLDKTVFGRSGNYGIDIENLPTDFILDERYKIVERIGTGGFGTVYKVWDDYTDRYKALKIIHKHFYSDKEVISDLKQEAKILMNLRSEHVVRLWDIHLKGATKYIDMEYIEQGDLVDLKLSYPGKKIPEEKVIELTKQMVNGMKYIHDNNVIHKDIKPQNIMLTKNGIVKIMDFGISETFRSSMSRIKETSRSGTPAYMSPEQLIGKDVGKESDIWSFGVMLYELLSGKQLFTGKTTSEIHHSIREKLDVEQNKETRQFNQYGSVLFPDDISEAIETILQKCLQYNYQDRYRDFGEIEKELRRMEEEEKKKQLDREKDEQVELDADKQENREKRNDGEFFSKPIAISKPNKKHTNPHVNKSRRCSRLWLSLSFICFWGLGFFFKGEFLGMVNNIAGFAFGCLLTIISGIILLFIRRKELSGLEIVLYWFVLSISSIVFLEFLFYASNWEFFGMGEVGSGAVIGCLLTIISGTILLAKKIIGTIRKRKANKN